MCVYYGIRLLQFYGMQRGDNMTRDEFMDVVYGELHSDGDNNRANRIIDAADDYVDEYAPHWIPVIERPPEESGCYLVSVKNDHERRYSKTAWFEKGVWFARQEVIAWMPLPEPYKEATT